MDFVASLHPTPQAWFRNGALAPHIDAYAAYLRQGRYASITTRGYLACVAHFAHWMLRGWHRAGPAAPCHQESLRSPSSPVHGRKQTSDADRPVSAVAILILNCGLFLRNHLPPCNIRHRVACPDRFDLPGRKVLRPCAVDDSVRLHALIAGEPGRP